MGPHWVKPRLEEIWGAGTFVSHPDLQIQTPARNSPSGFRGLGAKFKGGLVLLERCSQNSQPLQVVPSPTSKMLPFGLICDSRSVEGRVIMKCQSKLLYSLCPSPFFKIWKPTLKKAVQVTPWCSVEATPESE